MSGFYTNVKAVKSGREFAWPFCRLRIDDSAGFRSGTELSGFCPNIGLSWDGDSVSITMGRERRDGTSLVLSTIRRNDIETFGEIYALDMSENKDIFFYQFPRVSRSLYMAPARKACVILDARPGEVYRVVWTNDATCSYYFVKQDSVDEVEECDLMPYLNDFETPPFKVSQESASGECQLRKEDWRRLC